MKDDRVYLLHISDCIRRIERYIEGGEAMFFRDEKTQDSVVRNLQTLAESTTRLSDKIKAAQPEVDWAAVKRFRNVLVHDYLGLNMFRVWDIATHELPVLKRKVSEMLAELG